MQTYTVSFTSTAQKHLDQQMVYLVQVGAPPKVAGRYIQSIVDYVLTLSTSPYRGAQHDNVLLGLRTTNYKGKADIAFIINQDALSVDILGVFFGGRDYLSALAK